MSWVSAEAGGGRRVAVGTGHAPLVLLARGGGRLAGASGLGRAGPGQAIGKSSNSLSLSFCLLLFISYYVYWNRINTISFPKTLEIFRDTFGNIPNCLKMLPRLFEHFKIFIRFKMPKFKYLWLVQKNPKWLHNLQDHFWQRFKPEPKMVGFYEGHFGFIEIPIVGN